MEMYEILLRDIVFHWVDGAVEFESLVIDLSNLVLVAHPNPLFDMVNVINIEGAIYGKRFLKIIG